MMNSSINKRTAVCVVMLTIFTFASLLLMELAYHNIGTVIAIDLSYFFISLLIVTYSYRSLKEENNDNETAIHKKIKLFMLLDVIVTMLITYYIQCLSPLTCKDLFNNKMIAFRTARMLLTLGMGALSTISCIIFYMVLILGFKVPVVDSISSEKLINENIAEKMSSGRYINQTPESVVGRYIRWIMCILSMIFIVVLGFEADSNDKSLVFYNISHATYDKSFNVDTVTLCIFFICFGVTCVHVFNMVMDALSKTMGARTTTICKMAGGLIKLFAIVFVCCLCLKVCGFNTDALIASAGVLSIVIGFGSQELIKDFISGLFIIFEGQFKVGDYVTVGDFYGEVLEIGIRTTSIKDDVNNVKIINNSQISEVINMTKYMSCVLCEIGIDYSADITKIEKILSENLHVVNEHLVKLKGPVRYAGVQRFEDSAVILKFVAPCLEGDRIQLTRDLNREIKLLFDNNGIEVPFPQVVIHNEQD